MIIYILCLSTWFVLDTADHRHESPFLFLVALINFLFFLSLAFAGVTL